MVNEISAIPIEIEEAARVNGAGPITMLLKIALALAVRMVASSLTLAFIYSWSSYSA
jgi:multiple sugar transport system permease protein